MAPLQTLLAYGIILALAYIIELGNLKFENIDRKTGSKESVMMLI